jgi:glycosyltransferase involved in cell wall biosynthesis
MIKDKKLLTIIMAVRNGKPYIEMAVNSILNQSFTEFKFIIVDNGSTDGTKNYLSKINDKRVKCFEQPVEGFIPTINFALEKVDTKYVATMDSDDIAHPLKFEKQIKFMEQNDDVGLLGTSIEYFTLEKGRKWKLKFPTTHEKIIRNLVNGHYVICHPSTIVRTSVLKELNGLRDKYRFAPDLDMYMRVSRKNKLANLPEVLFSCRISNSSITSVNLPNVIRDKHRLMVDLNLNLKNNRFSKTCELYSLQFYKKGLYSYLNKSNLKGLFYFFCSIIFNPTKSIFHLRKKLKVAI